MPTSERFDAAVALALEDFRHVHRKGGSIPYMTHLLAVTALVGEAGGDEDQLIAAVLHDWLEDIGHATPFVLESRFGLRVRRLVEALSDSVVLPKPPWRARKERYVAQLREEPDEVRLISCADKLHNSRSLVRDVRLHGPSTLSRFRGGLQGTLWYYHSVHAALANGWSHWLLDELDNEVETLHGLLAVSRGNAVVPEVECSS